MPPFRGYFLSSQNKEVDAELCAAGSQVRLRCESEEVNAELCAASSESLYWMNYKQITELISKGRFLFEALSPESVYASCAEY